MLKADLDGRMGFDELLAQARQRALEAQAHQDLPFEQLVEALQPERNASHNPLFQVLFNHQSEIRSVTPEVQLEDLRLEGLAWDGQTAQFDLTLDIQEDENGIWASFDYATDLFDASTVERLAGHWRNLLPGCKPGTSATKPIRRPWPSWSIISTAMLLPLTGGTALPHPPMVSASGLAAGARAPGTSTRSTAASRGGCFTPISPTSTRRSAPAW